jgi:hypothetical protein
MPTDDFVGNGKKAAVRALGAPDRAFIAQASGPFIGTGGLVAGLAGLSALKPAGINIFAATKERAEQGDLGRG